jgi:3,4-dihydroxy 2-butanone 4-phosphate synthase/GTP cyclohydrolase II
MTQPANGFADIPTALAELQAGRMIVVVDDEDRENEGDQTLAAEFCTPEAINFMAKFGRGLICLTLTEDRADFLRLGPMTQDNTSRFGTAFTESIEAREGVTTGISAADRARTVQVAISPRSGPNDLARPGHIFPLRARKGGVLVRAGQTEASVDLAPHPRRRHLRDHERGRHHGARAGPDRILQHARPQDGDRRRTHPLPSAE